MSDFQLLSSRLPKEVLKRPSGLQGSLAAWVEQVTNLLNNPSVSSGTATVGSSISVDTISEYTAAHGVTIDSLNVKDQGITNLASLTATANLDIGGYELRAQTLEADVATGTAPLTIASTTLVTNLNADLLDGQQGSYYTNATNINAGTIGDGYLPATQTGKTFSTLVTGQAGLELTVASGDPYLQFDINGTDKFRVGVDDTDSDKFKVSAGSALGTNDALVIASDKTVGIGGDSGAIELSVSDSSSSTAINSSAAGMRISNTSATTNNYASITFGTAASANACGIFACKLIDRTNFYGAFEWWCRGASSATVLRAGTSGVGIFQTAPQAKLHGTGSTIVGCATAAVADANMGNSELNFWVNEAGNLLTFKVKYSDGTVKSGTVALA